MVCHIIEAPENNKKKVALWDKNMCLSEITDSENYETSGPNTSDKGSLKHLKGYRHALIYSKIWNELKGNLRVIFSEPVRFDCAQLCLKILWRATFLLVSPLFTVFCSLWPLFETPSHRFCDTFPADFLFLFTRYLRSQLERRLYVYPILLYFHFPHLSVLL